DEVGKDMDPFDMICHVVYGQPALTRKERADNVKKRNYFTKYGDTAQQVLNNLLDKYADGGVAEVENITVLKVAPFNEIGSMKEIINNGFGGKPQYLEAVNELEAAIYQSA
ncbi:DEAD/DEAH box helicase, partial [Vibrio anguillarum]|nr:DEAD/DEAH box helicase [Vibrio anguillarum]